MDFVAKASLFQGITFVLGKRPILNEMYKKCLQTGGPLGSELLKGQRLKQDWSKASDSVSFIQNLEMYSHLHPLYIYQMDISQHWQRILHATVS